jgi:hypothetical protein
MIRMLIVCYVFALRSERRLCAEVQVILAYRWFCKPGIEDRITLRSAPVFNRPNSCLRSSAGGFRRPFVHSLLGKPGEANVQNDRDDCADDRG